MPFSFETTPIEGLIIIRPRRFADPRGFFEETFKATDFAAGGITAPFLQDNHSYSGKGVLRGLHFQREPHAQGKLVQALTGAVWDAAVDLRPNSATYLAWYGITLTASEGTLFYIPPGFAHGFLTLEDDTHFLYKCTAEYAPAADGGVHWNDPDIAVPWPLEQLGEGTWPLISEKDRELPFLKELKNLGDLV
jgi:dTDP-4-dehydrorhamnose 3,5-epimerase